MSPKQNMLLIVFASACLLPVNANANKRTLGFGLAYAQPPQQGAKPAMSALPLFVYEGERLKTDVGSASYSLIVEKKFELAIAGQFRFADYDPRENQALAGMRPKKPTFELGLGAVRGGLWGELQLQAMADVSGIHNGYELTATYQMPYTNGRWVLEPELGLIWQSQQLVQYYYGVQEDEARADRPAYDGHAATKARAGFTVGYKFSRRWQCVGGMQYERLGTGIKESAILARTSQSMTYAALQYRF